MTLNAAPFETLLRYAEQLAAYVLARDNLHLAPSTVSRAVAKRMRAGLIYMQAYLRRVLILMALQIEHTLPRDLTERPIFNHGRVIHLRPATKSFSVFVGERAPPDLWTDAKHDTPKYPDRNRRILAAPLLDQWRSLMALIADPGARAKRLAYTLARRRPGRLLVPKQNDIPRRFGTELSALYDCMEMEIIDACRARPPPLGPIPRPPPRIRVL
jgi:hypothetical protein